MTSSYASAGNIPPDTFPVDDSTAGPSANDIYMGHTPPYISIDSPVESTAYVTPEITTAVTSTMHFIAHKDEHDQDNTVDSDTGTKPTSSFTHTTRDTTQPDTDLVHSIMGMYRILDLISEHSSGGLVDKIIISQESLGRLINDLRPGAYASMTKVDFAALDKLAIKPLGIYGSKSEIVRFLVSKGVIDEAMASALLSSTASEPTSTTERILRSGLYILRATTISTDLCGPSPEDAEILYVIYWPEDTTWDINATSSVLRNRATFMRYLTKIADQVVALVSDDDASKIVWKEENENIQDNDSEGEDEDDRMVIFQVTKTREEKENVTARPGFSMNIPQLRSRLSSDPNVDPALLKPRLIPGDVQQGLLTVTYQGAQVRCERVDEVRTPVWLQKTMSSESLHLSEDMTFSSLDILMGHGLNDRAEDVCRDYRADVEAITRRSAEAERDMEDQIRSELEQATQQLEQSVRQACVDVVMSKYPVLNRDILAGHRSFGEVYTANMQNASDDSDVKSTCGAPDNEGTVMLKDDLGHSIADSKDSDDVMAVPASTDDGDAAKAPIVSDVIDNTVATDATDVTDNPDITNTLDSSRATDATDATDTMAVTDVRDATETLAMRAKDASCTSETTEIIDATSVASPSDAPNELDAAEDTNATGATHDKKYLEHLKALYPEVQTALANDNAKDYSIKSVQFDGLKQSILIIDILLRDHRGPAVEKKAQLVKDILEKGERMTSSKPIHTLLQKAFSLFRGPDDTDQRLKAADKDVKDIDDETFFAKLDDIVKHEPLLSIATHKAMDIAYHNLVNILKARTNGLTKHIRAIQEKECKCQIQREVKADKEKDLESLRVQTLQKLRNCLPTTAAQDILILEQVEQLNRDHHPQYRVVGRRESQDQPALQYTVHPFLMTQNDRQQQPFDPTYVPTPRIHPSTVPTFKLPINSTILHSQLMSNGKLLLIVDDSADDIKIYLEPLSAIGSALMRPAPKKVIRRERIGECRLIAFDEATRTLAVLGISQMEPRVQLYIFVFDETFMSLQALGSSFSIQPWYDAAVAMTHMAFVSGKEELALVDDTAQVRIFSFVTRQFRPASQQLHRVPISVFSSPDGSCLLTVDSMDDKFVVRAFHWSTFGSSSGILVDIAGSFEDDLIVTSLARRASVHIVSLDMTQGRCTSIALDITHRATEFSFQEKGQNGSIGSMCSTRTQNCFADCHEDVWTRFPVIPAVQRQAIKSSTWRSRRTLSFVTSQGHSAYVPYFADMISKFERTTRKPTGSELSDIVVKAIDYDTFIDGPTCDLSCFHAGEWLVDLLCLIPIHIAVTRDNRFIPLKDGVWSEDLERSLLGADVARIVDSLSFGWYESLFQSYMATKKVKVVSSMGEQSVGKSFALNHLVDTSFAGSAMRTTEGVWMSATPLDDLMIVALDFEGVHSIERTAQEDTLLVLFNTALSNLVLFRNNFALSRDITGLFRSFQSSSSVLDPTANPSLFRSTLMIIIKDVVESDKKEIIKEFSLKFEQIVQQEQEHNFISQLHGGQLAIVPWPVIESRQFYTLFSSIKRRLDKQETTHSGASIFLQTMKTLMAKLKANDWGALSQNMAAHRAQLLLACLPRALAYGATEIVPGIEPLKDYDSGEVIKTFDTSSTFWVSELAASDHDASCEEILQRLICSWDKYSSNGIRSAVNDADWVAELGEFLANSARLRIEHVEEWLRLNTARFPSTQADIQALRRAANNIMIDLKSTVQLCELQCSMCYLSCILRRHHDGQHVCRTTHGCGLGCQYEGHENEPCGLPAGHSGTHVCGVDAHLCGHPCILSDRPGCLKECTKAVDHEEAEHMCSATIHECGEPCGLSGIRLENGQVYTCPERCHIPSHQQHEEHICANRQCPLQCELCKRLCANPNHYHPLEPNAVHLCGQEHPCSKLCSAKGICQIDTTPQSVEATFTGRHETFHYTKYTQVSKRLPCVIPIEPGRIDHIEKGPHSHSFDHDPFHFCEAQCPMCGYYCTLSLEHPQQEHETSHGSMSRTHWAIDETSETHIEIGGRRFGANDEGAPLLCSMFCSDCDCGGPDHEHIRYRMQPSPDRPKDWISHGLHWRRTGFKDPSPHEERVEFALCDSMCSGKEHTATARNGIAQPSYCILPILHARYGLDQPVPGNGLGYISNDGHVFNCLNPAVMHQAFHVIFVIDCSGSMSRRDRRPLQDRPSTALITRRHNNRLGAAYSSLDAFWNARRSAVSDVGQGAAIRRDAYTVLLFDDLLSECLVNDFTSTPEQLLTAVLQYTTGGGTNFAAAIRAAQTQMERHWSTERTPVVVFLSDGESEISDDVVQDLCLRSIALGKPLSFHAVAFGPCNRVMRRMAQVAIDIQSHAPPDPMTQVPTSSYAEALDSVQLAETFLSIADSLRKTRGSLLYSGQQRNYI